MMKTTFLLPYFSSTDKNKVHINIKTDQIIHYDDDDDDDNQNNNTNNNKRKCEGTILTLSNNVGWHTSIASHGIITPSTSSDGVYVFAVQQTPESKNKDRNIAIGFTSSPTFDTSSGLLPGASSSSSSTLPGTMLDIRDHQRVSNGSWHDYPMSDAENRNRNYKNHAVTTTTTPEEILTVLRISRNGTKFEIRWVVDGAEGPIVDCTKDLITNNSAGSKIYPAISLSRQNQQVRTLDVKHIRHLPPFSLPHFKMNILRPKLIEYFEEHAPYNLKRVDFILQHLKTFYEIEKYLERMQDMYHDAEVCALHEERRPLEGFDFFASSRRK